MKVILGAFLACTLFAFSSGPSNDVPQKVKEAFAKKFPTAKKVKWDKESKTEWEAEFQMNDLEYSANFNLSGTWMETEYVIGSEDLPSAIIETLAADFADYELGVAELTETADGKIFELLLENSVEEIELSLNIDGEVLKSAPVEEDEGNEAEEGEEEDED